jgi:hypothetical protein
MKKAATYYFALFAVANVFVAHVFSILYGELGRALREVLEGKHLPAITQTLLLAPWWPYVFAGLFLVGALMSLGTRWRSETLCHAVIVLLALEAFVLFCNVAACSLPFVSIIISLSKP